MPTLRDRLTGFLVGEHVTDLKLDVDRLAEVNQVLTEAYLSGTFELPPDQLITQLTEAYDPQLVQDLLDRLNYEVVGGYGQSDKGERNQAVRDSRRMFKYSIQARWIINLWTYYGLGTNVNIIPTAEDAQEVWQEFWDSDKNQTVLAKDRLDELSRWLLVAGERFFVFFASELDGETTIRTLDPVQITNVYADPMDNSTPWFYERTWLDSSNSQKKLYYADWQLFFSSQEEPSTTSLEQAWADTQEHYSIKGKLAEKDKTAAVVLFVPFIQLDEDSLRGWPLLAPHGTPWIRALRDFMQDRATVSKAVAAIVRRYKVQGGSRAVDAIQRTLASAFQFGGATESNPPPPAGSMEILNKSIDAKETPLHTGASDAKTDSEMFIWNVGLAGGIYPHYMGLGDAYRLATATSMERPMEMQFTLYRDQLSAMFRKMVRIVLRFQELYNHASYDDYSSEVSTDRLVEADLELTTNSVATILKDIIPPDSPLTKAMEPDTYYKLGTFLIQKVLEALGSADVQDILTIDDLKEPADGMLSAPKASNEEPPAQSEESFITERVDEITGKVIAKGQPLDPITTTDPIAITPEEVALALRSWDEVQSPSLQGLLVAPTASDEQQSSAIRDYDVEGTQDDR